MTIKITKLRLGAAILALALFVPATAWATHVFLDVVDSKFYAVPAEWAKTNEITTGVGGTDFFKPEDPVTRGESVTFLKRYNDNVAVPEIGNTLFGSDTNLQFTMIDGDVGLSVSVTIPENHTGVIELGFSAESSCTGGDPGGWCQVDLLVNGVELEDGDSFAFDSSDNVTETNSSWEAHAMIRVTTDLPAGTYVVTAEASRFGTPTFRLDEMVLTAEVHLTS